MILDANPFGFATDQTSSISIVINGSKPYTECDVLFSFGDGHHYISAMIAMDGGLRLENGLEFATVWVYPTSGGFGIGNVSTLLPVTNSNTSTWAQAARDAISGGDYNNFEPISTVDDRSWPIIVDITNDLDANQTDIVISNGLRSASFYVTGTFNTGSSLGFGIINDLASYEGIEIYSIEVGLSEPTPAPTAAPTDSMFIGDSAMTWSQANTYCTGLGRELISIHDNATQIEAEVLCASVHESVSSSSGCWIGLKDNGI